MTHKTLLRRIQYCKFKCSESGKWKKWGFWCNFSLALLCKHIILPSPCTWLQNSQTDPTHIQDEAILQADVSFLLIKVIYEILSSLLRNLGSLEMQRTPVLTWIFSLVCYAFKYSTFYYRVHMNIEKFLFTKY